jgi:hypothetical protein
METGPGSIITFLYYFAMTTLVMTLIATQSGLYQEVGVPILINPLIGVVAGALGAYFNRTVAISVPFKNRKTFLRTLEEALEEMGYERDREVEDWTIYRRSAVRQLFSGKIYVKLSDGMATLSSRSVHIRTLQQHLEDMGLGI